MKSYEDLPAVLLPALHHLGSSFIRIYCKDGNEYRYSILVESCVEDGFLYKIYYNNQKDPGSLGNSRHQSHIINYYIPIGIIGNISDYILELENSGYLLAFTREVDTNVITTLMERKIQLFGTKACILAEALDISRGRGMPTNPLNIGLTNFKSVKFDLPKYYHTGFKEIRTGAVITKDENTISLTGDLFIGFGGTGFTKALIKCFESEAAMNLKNVTINLTGNGINEDYLIEAIQSGKIPDGVTFLFRSHEFEKRCKFELNKIRTYKTLFTVYLYLIHPDNHRLFFVKDVMQIVIAQYITLFNQAIEEKYMFLEFKPEPISFNHAQTFFQSKKPLHIDFGFNQRKLVNFIQKMAESVVKKLAFPFTFNEQEFMLTSQTLRDNLENELMLAYTTIFSKLAPIQKNILIDLMNEKIPGHTHDSLIGDINPIKESFDVVTGSGLEPYGMVGVCYANLSIDSVNVLFTRDKDKTLSATHDKLNDSPLIRVKQYALTLFIEIAKAANLDQLAVLLADSTNKDSDCMKLLTENNGVFSVDYGKRYCIELDKIMQEKSLAESDGLVSYRK